MSDRKPARSCEYTRVGMYDDDDKLPINKQGSCMWIVSKLNNIKEWLSGTINQIFCKRRVPEELGEPYKYQLEAEKLREECRNLEIRFSDSQAEVRTLESKLSQTEETLNDERQEKKTFMSKLSDSQAEVRTLESNLSQTEETLNDERREKKTFMSKFEEERKEKEKALTRLSSIAGDKLRLNNPGITDLSDENRPNKLGEKFSELYDNEWTEAYESLENAGLNEEEIIKKLLDILKEVYTCCQQYAKVQRQRLIQVISLPFRSDEQLQDAATPEKVLSKVVDLQKQTASIALSDVKNTIITTRSEFADNEVKEKYMVRCMQLCWMMAIQDPPMLLDFGPAQNEDFDKNLFRLYTKQGNRVDFIVWPALFLHVNGPIVQKGVLQPKPS